MWGAWNGPRPEPPRHASDLIESYGNAVPEDHTPGRKAFHVIRDPRDLLVSAYFSHRNSHATDKWPQLEAQRRKLKALPFEDGLIATMDFIPNVFHNLKRWDYSRPEILELRMEDLCSAPYEGWLEIMEHLGVLEDDLGESKTLGGLKRSVNRLGVRFAWAGVSFTPFKGANITGESVLSAVYDNRFKKLSKGREKGQVDESSHYRSGQPGDWKNYFKLEVMDAFRDRFGELPRDLGYTE